MGIKDKVDFYWSLIFPSSQKMEKQTSCFSMWLIQKNRFSLVFYFARLNWIIKWTNDTKNFGDRNGLSVPLSAKRMKNGKLENRIVFSVTIVSFTGEIKSQFTFWKVFFSFSQVPDEMDDCALPTLPHDPFKHQEKQKKQPQKMSITTLSQQHKTQFYKTELNFPILLLFILSAENWTVERSAVGPFYTKGTKEVKQDSRVLTRIKKQNYLPTKEGLGKYLRPIVKLN